MKLGVPDRLRSGDLLHERQACCLDYTTRTEMERVNGIAPSSRPWHGRILLLNHTRKNGVPSRTLTDNLTLRTRPLCALSYGDKESNPWPFSSTGSHPSLSGSAGPLELLRVQEFETACRAVALSATAGARVRKPSG